ncbi:MAG: substrate-binding domain-containing protein [Herbiconiux sp.]|nr:substrate-binding domain-containing protein [Herbiconiux sp.]
MRNARFAAAAAAALVLGITVTGCTSDANPSDAAGTNDTTTEGKTVAIVTAGSNSPYYTALRCGAERSAKDFGFTVQFQGTPSTEPREEMTVFNSVVATDPDAMVLIPWDSEAFVAPAQAFADSGKLILTADGVLNEKVDLQNISTNGDDAGSEVAQQLIDDGLTGTVLIVTHSPGNVVQMARTTGFRATLEAAGIDVLETQYAGSDASKAASIVSGAITGNPDLSLVFTTMDTIGQGSASAIAADGKEDDIKLIGYDADPAAVTALKEGKYAGIISQSPDFMGFESIQTIGKVMSGEVDADSLEYNVDSPVMYITADNVDTPEAAPFLYTGECSE